MMARYVIALGLVPLMQQMMSRLRERGRAAQIRRYAGAGLGHALLVSGAEDAADDVRMFGAVYRRGSYARATLLSESNRDAIRASSGAHLIDTCWGNYVAALSTRDEPSLILLRPPMGELPCYYQTCAGMFVAASDADLLELATDRRPPLDWAGVSRHLVANDIRHGTTCLSGVHELQSGQRARIDRGALVGLDELWSPWTMAAAEYQIRDPHEAECRVRDAVRATVRARASEFRRPLLKLSGGLDSSIVAACLADTGQPFDCLNLVTHDAAGDERHYAEAVAGRLGVPLFERYRETLGVDLTRSEVAHLPRPTRRSFTQESTRHCHELAGEAGNDGIIDGGCGDNVFCSLQSLRPIVDAMREADPAAVRETIASVAEITRMSYWSIWSRAWLRRWRARAVYPWRTSFDFLSRDAIALSKGAADHPWFVTPPGALPGKAAHVALVTQSQSVAEDGDPQDLLPACSPLAAQPVVEACLRVPSWMWFDGGLNRAVARRAFADFLPEMVSKRRSKAAPDGFIAQIYESRRAQVAELLLDGALARAGLLDRPALEAALADRAPVRGPGYQRILLLVDVEAWARARS